MGKKTINFEGMKGYKLCVLVVLLLVGSFSTQASNDSLFTYLKFQPQNKGKFYFYWGYNRSLYSNSDIKFEGRDFDYELFDVQAKDRQTKFDWNEYFHPSNLTIPQTNTKFGYFFSDKYSVSIGVDHMKYVMVQDQSAKITGTIDGTGTVHDGVYENEDKVLTQEFLIFEHTDGLNYLNVELSRWDGLVDYRRKIQLQSVFGVGAAAMLPKTNAVLFNRERYDDFHLAGYGLHAKAGINLRLWKYFFIQTEGKTGFIHMPDIRPTQYEDEKASQHFFFGEYTILFGFNLQLKSFDKSSPASAPSSVSF